MADEELGTGSVSITLDDASADADLNRLGDRIESILDRAARNAGRRIERQLNQAISRISPLEVQVTPDLSRFEAALNNLNNLGSTPLRVTPEVDRTTFVQAVQDALAGAEVTINVVPDLSGFDERIRAHRAPSIDIETNVDNDRLGRALSGLGKAAGGAASIAKMTVAIGALGIASAAAAQSIVALGAALAPVGGLIAAGPAVILGYSAALGSLKLALTGVSDAFSAALTGDAKEFDKALKELSPQAQKAALEVRALKPAFETLKNTVQDNFFAQIEGQITKTANTLKGPLTQGLAAISGQWGRATNNVLGYIQGAKGVDNIKSILNATALSVEGLSRTTNKLTAGFLQAGAAIADEFGDDLANGISVVGERFGTFLQQAAADGRLVAFVDNALTALAQLGDLLGNIGGILSGVFNAAQVSGGGFLANLQQITQSFETFVKSAEGQEAITNIFRTIAAVAAQLGPIFAALVQAVGAIAPALAPLLTTIGPAIVGVINALLPAIQALLPGITVVVNAIVTALNEITASGALADIGKAFGDVLTAIAPLLPVIGQLVASIAQSLAPVIQLLAEALTPVITAIANALTPILPPLIDVVLQLVDALAPVVDIIGVALAGVITALAPLLLTLATTFGQIVQAIAPLITQLVDGLAPIIEAIAPIVTRLVAAIAPLVVQLVNALLPVLPPIIDAFLAILDAMTPLIEPVVQLVEALAPLVATIISAVEPVIQLAAELLKWVSLNVLVPMITDITNVLITLVTAATDVIDGIRIFVDSIVGFFTDLDGKVGDAVSGLVEDVKTFFTDLKDDAVRKTSELVASVVTFFQQLPDRARSALSSLGSALGQAVGSAATSLLNRVTTLISDAVQLFRDLPTKAKNALGNLGSTLYSAGQDLVRGLINGVKSLAGDIANAAKDVVSGAVKSAKNFLGIASPSKVFIEIGKFVGQGLVQGLTGSAASVRQAADKLVAQITKAFQGKNTRLDETLIASVRTTQRRLEALAKQREALAQRIQAANEFAAKTTQDALNSFSLGNLAEDPIGPGGLASKLRSAANQIRNFTNQVNALAKRGLRRDLLSQLIGLGPEAGAALASQLSRASAAQIKELNAAQAQLDAAAKKLGRDSADVMFDAGVNASKGFLAGLKSQQKQIEALMVQIAKGLSSAIRKALGIKSPSTVLREIGLNTGQGLVNGIAAMARPVEVAAQRMAVAALSPFQSNGPVPAVVRPVSGVASPFRSQPTSATGTALTRAPAASDNTSITNNIVINEVGDGEATARRVINRLALQAGVF